MSDLVKVIAKDATAGKGPVAADVALKEFIHTLNSEDLPFKVVSYKELKANKKFIALGSKRAPIKVEKEESGFGSFMSKVNSFTGNDAPVGSGPDYLQNFGLVKNWWDGKAHMGTSDEAEYIKEAINVLGVDAVIIVNDPGYSFSCDACVGGTGSASTGSAFTVSVVNKTGKSILDVRQWFGTSPGSAAIVTGIVNPLQQESLFKQHGIKTAKLFVEEFKEALTEKNNDHRG